jgi:anti-sigma factor RsiW
MSQRPEDHNHMIEEDLLKAVVDPADLSADQEQHLNACPACRGELVRLERRYARIGEVAQALAPAPSRPFRLPEKGRRQTGRQLKPILAVGLTAALLLAVVVWWPGYFDSDKKPVPVTAQTLEDDRRLMTEVDALIENALPAPLRELAAVSEPPSDPDEDLINWIVPSIEEDDSLT